MSGACEYGDELWGSINAGNFLISCKTSLLNYITEIIQVTEGRVSVSPAVINGQVRYSLS